MINLKKKKKNVWFRRVYRNLKSNLEKTCTLLHFRSDWSTDTRDSRPRNTKFSPKTVISWKFTGSDRVQKVQKGVENPWFICNMEFFCPPTVLCFRVRKMTLVGLLEICWIFEFYFRLILQLFFWLRLGLMFGWEMHVGILIRNLILLSKLIMKVFGSSGKDNKFFEDLFLNSFLENGTKYLDEKIFITFFFIPIFLFILKVF